MKKFLIAGVAAASFCGAPALAADMPVKAPPPPPVAVYSWTGFYGGLSLGARSAENHWTTTGFGSIAIAAGVFPGSDANQSFDRVAARIGGYTGYNWQVASTWVVGVEADIGWANNQKTKVGIPGTATATLGPHVTSGDTAFVNESWDGSDSRAAGRSYYANHPALRQRRCRLANDQNRSDLRGKRDFLKLL